MLRLFIKAGLPQKSKLIIAEKCMIGGMQVCWLAQPQRLVARCSTRNFPTSGIIAFSLRETLPPSPVLTMKCIQQMLTEPNH
jgi:hypothetical protein